MLQVFVSHSTHDRGFVEKQIVPVLEENGYRPWYAPQATLTGEQWEDSIRSGLESCELFLVVLSPASVKSEWVRAEVHWAINNRKEKVLPVLMQSCRPEDLHLQLPLLQHLDFSSDNSLARNRLIAALKDAGTHKREGARSSGPSPLSQKAAAFLAGWFAKKVLTPDITRKEPVYAMIGTYLRRFGVVLPRPVSYYLSDASADGGARDQEFTQSAYDAFLATVGHQEANHFGVASNILLVILPCLRGPASDKVRNAVQDLVSRLDLPAELRNVPEQDMLGYANRIADYYERVQ